MFCLAAALLATNVWLVVDRDPTLEVTADMPATRTRHAETDRLAWLRAARYAGFRAERCGHADPLATLDADIDPEPGREHVIGNREHGVAVFAEDGELLATMRGIGCDGDPFAAGDQSLSISFDAPYLVLRARRLAPDGEYLDAHIVERRDDELATLAKIHVGGKRSHWEAYGALDVQHDHVDVKTHGRQRVGGKWVAVDEHRTYSLR